MLLPPIVMSDAAAMILTVVIAITTLAPAATMLVPVPSTTIV
jgi:hypothetical protein